MYLLFMYLLFMYLLLSLLNLYSSSRHNPRRHIHRRQFLKQQFTRIRDLYQRKVRPILACLTEVNTSFVIIGRNDSALATYMNFVFIRTVVHTPPRES
jgi:hypothetical protein